MQLAYPISIAVVASSISILIWVWFWTRKQSLDNKSAIFVFVGGAIAVLFALPFQKAFSIFIPGSPPIVLFLWATVEEVIKLSVVLCAIKFLKIDRAKTLIYMIVAALGFAALENVLYVVGPLIGEDTTRSVITGNLRFIWGTIFSFSITWVLALVFIYIVFKKDTKTPKKEMSVFVLIVILFISVGVYLNEKLPKYTPEVLGSWQVALKDVETSQASLKVRGTDFTESISALDSIHFQLKSILVAMEKNNDLSIEERQFMDDYDEKVQAYKDKLPKYKSEVLTSWQEALKEMEDIYTEHISLVATNPNFSKSLMVLYSILFQLKEVVKIMEENRGLSPDQIDFMSSYNAHVNQFLCIFRNEKGGTSTKRCSL